MNRKQHTFTRNNVTYDCHARAQRGARSRHFVWRATTDGVEYRCFPFTGSEFDNPAQRRVFEDAIVVAVGSQQRGGLDVEAETILKRAALTPGRLIQHRDGRHGVAQELDVTQSYVLFEFMADRMLKTEWVPIADVAISELSAAFRPLPPEPGRNGR